MPVFIYPDPYMRRILRETKTIAMVGASANPERPSWQVMSFMQDAGYRVIPVNPGLAGQQLLGEEVYETLSDIPEPFDMVDIFRLPEAAGALVDEAIELAKDRGIKTIWMQLGVHDAFAAQRARKARLDAIMCRCPKIEIERLHHRQRH